LSYELLKIQRNANELKSHWFQGAWISYFLIIISAFFTIMVSLSIIFTRQHYIIDALTTYFLGALLWIFIRKNFSYSGHLFS
jgi:uncharacterized membrane protein